VTSTTESIEIVFENGWKIELRGYRFGPFRTRREALETAEMWAAADHRQGRSVSLNAAPTLARLRLESTPPVRTRS